MNPLVFLPQLNQATVFTLITSFFSTQIALFRLEKQDKNCWTKTCNHCYQNMTFQWTGRFFARTIARTILSRFYQKLKGDFLKFGVFATWTQIHLVIEWVREGVCICKLCFGICEFVCLCLGICVFVLEHLEPRWDPPGGRVGEGRGRRREKEDLVVQQTRDICAIHLQSSLSRWFDKDRERAVCLPKLSLSLVSSPFPPYLFSLQVMGLVFARTECCLRDSTPISRPKLANGDET